MITADWSAGMRALVKSPVKLERLKMTTNRRRFSRVDSEIDATLEYDGQEFVSELLDLSISGTLINTAASPKKGETVTISFTHGTGDEAMSVRCLGRVMRADTKGVGIEFDRMSMESLEQLRDIVEGHSIDPSIIAEEIDRFLQETRDEAT